MNTKIPLSKLAEALAEATSSDTAASTQFVKDLFAIIEEEVSLGKTVYIPELGSFSKSSEPSDPIAFSPDESFAAQLNEEFAMFSPVELNDGVTEQVLDEIEETSETEAAEPAEAVEEVKPTEENEKIKEVIEETVEVKPEPAVTEEESSTEVKVEVETEIKEQAEAEPVAKELEPSEPETTEETTDEKANEESKEESAKETPAESSEKSTIIVAEVAAEEQPSLGEIPEQDEEYVVVRRSKSRFGLGLVLGLILGFVLGVIAFIAYLVHFLKIPVENILMY